MSARAIFSLLTAAALCAGPVATTASAADEPFGDSPTVMVKATSAAAAEAIAASHGLDVKRGFPSIDWYELSTPDGTTSAAAAQDALNDDPAVLATDAVQPTEDLTYAFQPRDPYWTSTSLLGGGEPLTWHLAKANFPSAWDVSTGAGALIGIVDSEFDTTHGELSAKVRSPYNTSSGTPNYHTGNVRAEDTDSVAVLHGTHVAGIAAAATDNGVGVSGAGFDANFVPVRIRTSFQPGNGNPVDANFVADLAEGLLYLEGKGISVVNMSLGGTRPHQPLADAIARLRNSGVTIVAAAGNFQQSSPNAAIYPASYPGVIAVANTQFNDQINPSSSNGDWVDVAAPGTNILSTWENRDTSQGGTFTGDTTNRYNAISGTSMAAPVVTGLVALMKSVRPDLTPDEVEGLLKSTARDLGSGGVDPQFGYGLIDAAAAVNAAKAYVRPVPPAPPAAAPAPAPPADTTAPSVTLRGSVSRKGGHKVAVRFVCNEGCTGRVKMYAAKDKAGKKKGSKLSSKKFTGLPGKRVIVDLKTTRKIRARQRVIIQIKVSDGTGNTTTLEYRKKLK